MLRMEEIVLEAMDRVLPPNEVENWSTRPNFDLDGLTPHEALDRGRYNDLVEACGLTDVLSMWRCLLAAAITFPLVFGWVYFETLPGDLTSYRIFVFGIPTIAFPHESLIGHLIFHGLVWASFLVIAGVLLALNRRL